MAFFVNRQITKGMNSENEDRAGGQAGMLGIDRGELGIGRDMLGIGRDILGIDRDMLGIGRGMLGTGRDMLGSRTCRNYNPHRGRKYLHLWG